MFLPISKKEMKSRGWDSADFILITGDAYVDHPSFGAAIISRVLEARGFRVAVLSQPNWKNDQDFLQFGQPRLGFLVTSGNIDSMVAHYTAAKKKRSDDAYSPGNKAGRRPDRAVIVYSTIVRRLYPDAKIIIGGLEASLRRFAHYDYWEDQVRPSILVDSKADILVYGMGEKTITEIGNRLNQNKGIKALYNIPGLCYLTDSIAELTGIELPPFSKISTSKRDYAQSCKIEQNEHDSLRGKALFQKYNGTYLVANPPMPPLDKEELDFVYALPYERACHPIYERMGKVPAIEEVEFSITHNRGCFGGCNFCSIAFHQGRKVTARSKKSVIKEAKMLTKLPGFKGYIHDVGGPTANFRNPSCKVQAEKGLCKNKKCLAPKPCENLEVSHSDYLELLRALRKIPKIKKVFIRSGLRYDYLLEDQNEAFLEELTKYHVSGQLKVAPEHCSPDVLNLMGKPGIDVYEKFAKKYFSLSEQAGKEQYLVPYFISSHPGSTVKDAVRLAEFLKKNNLRPQQVQDFYPTPGTVSTAMYYTGLDPFTLKPVYVPKERQEKEMQRALLQWFKPENRAIVTNALKKAGRLDLIGSAKNCLVPKGSGDQFKKTERKNTKWKNSEKNRRKR